VIIKNGTVLLDGFDLRECDLRTVDGRIVEVGEDLPGKDTIDAEGCYVLPGLIDIHTHGIGYESSSDSSLVDYAKLEAEKGTTCFYPTLFDTKEAIVDQLRRHRKETNELRSLPQIPGFRLESPYIARTGAGLSEHLEKITDATTNMILEAGDGLVKLWDVSPELDGACDLVRKLTLLDIVCCMTHTGASIDQARASVDAGIKIATHLFNVYAPPEVTEPGCQPAGLTDYVLTDDRIVAEIIPDGSHVHPILIEKTMRCKGPERIALVTDSNYGAGLPSGTYDLPASWGRCKIDGPNNGVRMVDRGMGLAGSALTPINAFQNAVHMFGYSITDAATMCSETQARVLGLNKGRLAVGKDADIIIVDDDLELEHTICAGKVIWSR
jgi:N-acetylglucosamine-6-phosphate deacetylase